MKVINTILATILVISLPGHAQAEDFNCFTRELWLPEKKEYCCREKNLGCPPDDTRRSVATEDEVYNCFSRELWSPTKKDYCCRVKNINCPAPQETRETSREATPTETLGYREVTYDCRSRERWTGEKIDWCCKNKDICPPPIPMPTISTTIHNCFSKEIWTNEKKDYCCKTQGLGCPAVIPSVTRLSTSTAASAVEVTIHNCFSREVWTNEKKDYCCKTKGLGCPPSIPAVVATLTQHNCFSKEMWSDEKRSYCCENMGIGCLDTNTVAQSLVQPASEKPQLLPELSVRSGENTDEEIGSTNSVIHLTLREAKANTLSLIWATSENMCQEEVFTITYAPMYDGEILKDQSVVTTSLRTFTELENLLPGVQYHVSVATSNKDSPAVEDIFKTRKRNKKGSQKNTKNIGNKMPKRRSAGSN